MAPGNTKSDCEEDKLLNMVETFFMAPALIEELAKMSRRFSSSSHSTLSLGAPLETFGTPLGMGGDDVEEEKNSPIPHIIEKQFTTIWRFQDWGIIQLKHGSSSAAGYHDDRIFKLEDWNKKFTFWLKMLYASLSTRALTSASESLGAPLEINEKDIKEDKNLPIPIEEQFSKMLRTFPSPWKLTEIVLGAPGEDDAEGSRDLQPIPVLFTISEDFLSVMTKICDTMSIETLFMIKESLPESQVEVIEASDGTYARWKKHVKIPDSLKDINWKGYYDPVRDQGSHDTCWAFVSTELVSCLRFIKKYDEKYTRYSTQDLVDFAAPDKKGKENHYCYGHTIVEGLKYIKEKGVQREEDREYVGCRRSPPPRDIANCIFIKDVKSKETYEEMFEMLLAGPVGVALAIFTPDYKKIGDQIYRGPMFKSSRFTGYHAAQIMEVRIENGEVISLIRSSHGDSLGVNGYLKVSMEVMLLHIPKDGNVRKPRKFGVPTFLLNRFCCPELLSKKEEIEKQRRE